MTTTGFGCVVSPFRRVLLFLIVVVGRLAVVVFLSPPISSNALAIHILFEIPNTIETWELLQQMHGVDYR